MPEEHKSENPSWHVHKTALIILLALFLFVPVYIWFSDNKDAAVNNVFELFKTLAIFAAGYIFKATSGSE